MRSSSLIRALVVAMAAVFTAVACGTGGSTNAGSIKILAAWSGQEQASFFAVLKPWEDRTGIKVNYEYSRDLDALLTTRLGAGNPPDMSAAPSPTTLTTFVKQGKVIPLDDKIDVNALKANYAQSWIDLGTINGKLYETFSWVAVKGLIWYDPKNFAAKSYNVPTSWQGLLDLQSTIKSNGTTPWCVALESGSASGWPGSDWLKEIVLSQSGPTVYDGWVAGTQKWTSPEIKSAFTTWGTVLGPNDSNVYGGKQFMLATAFGDGGTHMFDNPPKCYMHNQASFITTFFTSAVPTLQPVTDFNFFPLPDFSVLLSDIPTLIVVIVGVPVVLAAYIVGGEYLVRRLPDKNRPRVRPWIWVGPAVFLVAAILFIPAIFTVIQSFEDNHGTFVGLQNYGNQLPDFPSGGAWVAIRNNIII